MGSLGLQIKYRPIRIGWCIRHGNFEDYRKALHLTHTLWGGKVNPLIPVDDEVFAKQLINLFQADSLYPVAEDERIQKFIERFPYLPWPEIHKKFFIDGFEGKVANFLDIYHPLRSKTVAKVENLCKGQWISNCPSLQESPKDACSTR